ncbi:MAG TPA: GH92 family glycosyl hydrolase [Lentimicrobium sp.]|nr:GH92 family glycosyl hydrolase [Lentimicrobium sp.]
MVQPTICIMKKFLLFSIVTLGFINFLFAQQKPDKDYTQFVNPFIGSGSVDSLSLSGSNFPGACFPFGLVQLSPDTYYNPENPCSGYDYSRDTIVGFSHTHLSGTGVADLFDFLFMPFKGDLEWNPMPVKGKSKGYSSKFNHKNEFASPGYYSVVLDDPNMKVELSATEHAGIHRYSSLDKQPWNLIIDLDHSLDKSRPYWVCKIIDAQIRVIDDHTIEGYRTITGWASQRKVYFRAEFSQPFAKHFLKAGGRVYENEPIANHTNLKMIAQFKSGNEPLIIRVGLSSVSFEGARENLKAEINTFDFDKVHTQVKNAWNKELSVIDMEGSPSQKTIFYTSLYHLFIQPNNLADLNGNYINATGELKNAPDKKHYSTFSLWDTYRAAHPLYTIIQPGRTAGFINSMIRQYQDYGYLPIWQLWGKETYCMIGTHSIPVIVDAYNKGIKGIDYNLAWDAVNASSRIPHQHGAFDLLDKYKYIPENKQSQSVSIALEVAFNDWCAANMAKTLRKTDDYNYFNTRSSYYKNLFDPTIGFFRAKDDAGKWIEPFSPLKYGGNGGYPFTEGNGWQYLWYVPQDVYSFIDMLGGVKAFNAKLDQFFTLNAIPDDVNGNASGFIGQYAHGNEPSHHITYLYDFSGEPWKTQYYANKVMKEQFTEEPSGYSGNEDCGQMSAWYIFSAMGFYPVNPANGVYCFGSPQLPSCKVNLENGKYFEITTKNNSSDNIYIQKIMLNGKPYEKLFIRHSDIVNGGKLEFTMGNKPNKRLANYEKPPVE